MIQLFPEGTELYSDINLRDYLGTEILNVFPKRVERNVKNSGYLEYGPKGHWFRLSDIHYLRKSRISGCCIIVNVIGNIRELRNFPIVPKSSA